MEKELNDKLNDIHDRLMQAKADKLETHRDYVIKETIKRLKKIYPGKIYISIELYIYNKIIIII